MLSEIGFTVPVTPVNTDSQTAIDMMKRGHPTEKTKHLALAFHSVKEAVVEGAVVLRHVPGTENTSDLLTKPLPRVTFEKHCESLLRDRQNAKSYRDILTGAKPEVLAIVHSGRSKTQEAAFSCMYIDISGNDRDIEGASLMDPNDCVIEEAFLMDPDDNFNDVYMNFNTDTDPGGDTDTDSGNDSDCTRCSDISECPCFTGGVCGLPPDRMGIHDMYMAMDADVWVDDDYADGCARSFSPDHCILSGGVDVADWRDANVWQL